MSAFKSHLPCILLPGNGLLSPVHMNGSQILPLEAKNTFSLKTVIEGKPG